jgi:hypothetical protein
MNDSTAALVTIQCPSTGRCWPVQRTIIVVHPRLASRKQDAATGSARTGPALE